MTATKSSPAAGDRAKRERGAYLAARIKELQEEIKKLRGEMREAQTSIRASVDKKSPEAKKMKLRRAYAATRATEARKELSANLTERKTISGVRTK